MWHAFAEGFPGFNAINTTAQTLLFLVPFHAAVVMQLRNREHEGSDMARLVLIGLILLMAVNLLGYAMGMRNLVHGFEGRMNLPFLKGVYDAAHIMSIINLMLLFYLKDPIRHPFRFAALAAIYAANLAVMININSRLSFMVFLVFTVLFLLRVTKGLRGLYTISLFTMPLLVSFAHLVYKILSLPVFASIIERVDKEDVTTFNSRTYIWEEAWNWLVDDRRGFLLGNGFNGQYGLGMMDHIAVMWETDQPYDIHMHSTFLQVFIGQGLLGYLLLCLCMWYAYSRFRVHYLAGTNAAPLYAAVVYILFIWQIDIFLYGMEIGNMLFFSILSFFALDARHVTRRQRSLGEATPS
jgi:O-antigen ligase